MKKVISLLIAVLLMACAVVSVSAEISPTAPIVDDSIVIDAVPVPDYAGSCTPDVKNPVEYIVGEDGTVTLVASSMEGFKFTHWEFVTGEFDIVSGSLTSSTIVILPKGDDDIRAYAHFAEEDVPVTEPSSKPVVKPDDGTQSPTTGENTTVYFVAAATVLMLAFAVVVLKKKAC